MARRLAAIDLDGTLLNSKGEVSVANLRALDEWTLRGHELVLATARPLRDLVSFPELANLKCTAALSNGAHVIELPSKLELTRRSFEERHLVDAVARLKSLLPGISLALEFGTHKVREPDFVSFDPRPGQVSVDKLEAHFALGPIKVLVVGKTVSLDAVGIACTQAFDSTGVVTRSGDQFVEVSPTGVDKASALEWIRSALDIDRAAIVAIGDMLNDISMFEMSGLAVAVRNAHPEVLALADTVAPSNDEDGVAIALGQLLSSVEVQ
jgi:Cof subfamily protein (haloacid dehalogenase superfamily)